MLSALGDVPVSLWALQLSDRNASISVVEAKTGRKEGGRTSERMSRHVCVSRDRWWLAPLCSSGPGHWGDRVPGALRASRRGTLTYASVPCVSPPPGPQGIEEIVQ